MKKEISNKKYFAALSQIQSHYFCLGQLMNEKPRTPIEMAIDEVTGYGEYKSKKNAKLAMEWLKEIIKNKKIIGEDYTNDQKAIDAIEKLIK